MIKARGHMDVGNRAKQFAPFAALKGHEMELAKQLEYFDERIVLSEDEAEAINSVLSNLTKGDEIRLTYYDKNVYSTITGVIEKIFPYEFAFQIKDKKIFFEDIYRIQKMGL